MGLDLACLGLLAFARATGADFSRVATIGRQGLEVRNDAIADFFLARGRRDLAGRWRERAPEKYCEGLLQGAFGAKEVVSYDASNYEQANVIHDMNRPIAPTRGFSMVLDFGTLEHVFNVANAFDNVAALCAEGGRILHALPGNNLSGHGFYQYSPEFFFQLYAQARGYADTRVFASVAGDDAHWYEIQPPHALGRRVNLTSRRAFYLLAITRKVRHAVPLAQQPVQQSDYEALWTAAAAPPRQKRASALEEKVSAALSGPRSERKAAKLDIMRPRPDVTRRVVLELAPHF
jgi:hypothetical protein